MYTHGNSRTLIRSREPKFTDRAEALHLKCSETFRGNGDGSLPLLADVDSDCFEVVKSTIQETFPEINVSKIHLVNASQMFGMYLLRKEEMMANSGNDEVQEKFLYHVTTESRAIESLKSGLDWRRTRRSKFGCGVSFSDDADYANYYADKFTQEDTRVIIMCSVLVNNTHRVAGYNNSLKVPPGVADTTVSNNGHVFVKYNDNDFYPYFFVYFERRPEHLTKSKYFKANRRPGRQQMSAYCRLLELQLDNFHFTDNDFANAGHNSS